MILAAAGSAGLISCNDLKPAKEEPQAAPNTQVQAPEAELVSAAGTVLIRIPGRPEWQEVHTGAQLNQGTLIRTDNTGSAVIRYIDGTTLFIQKNTIFTVQSASQAVMEIASPPRIASPSAAKSTEAPPSLELNRIVPFGKSLELVGRVDAGSRLSVNGEIVDVSGDGSFKHFMDPFPASTKKADLVLKVTNLAGRTHVLKTFYDFERPGEDN